MEHYQPLDDYEGFQRKVSITNHNGTFYYVVMISRQGSDGSIESEVIVSDSENFPNEQAARNAADNASKQHIVSNLNCREIFKQSIRSKLNQSADTKNIELGDWEICNNKLHLSYVWKGKHRAIEAPDELNGVENPETKARLVDDVFNKIKNHAPKER